MALAPQFLKFQKKTLMQLVITITTEKDFAEITIVIKATTTKKITSVTKTTRWPTKESECQLQQQRQLVFSCMNMIHSYKNNCMTIRWLFNRHVYKDLEWNHMSICRRRWLDTQSSNWSPTGLVTRQGFAVTLFLTNDMKRHNMIKNYCLIQMIIVFRNLKSQ